MTFSLTVDTQSLSRSSLGQIAGVVYADFDGIAFPDGNWSDSIVLVLIAWIDAMRTLASKPAMPTTIHFMDGPFRIELQRQGEKVHIRALERRQRDVVKVETHAEWDTLHRTVIVASAAVLKACRQTNWQSADVDHLEQAVKVAAA
jgi:hypothetical protein